MESLEIILEIPMARLVEVGGQWYVFYHRQTNKRNVIDRVCRKIYFYQMVIFHRLK